MLSSPLLHRHLSSSASYPNIEHPSNARHAGSWTQQWFEDHASLNNQPQGDTVLDRIFRQNVSILNFLIVLLGRSNDPAEKYPGDITMGEIL